MPSIINFLAASKTLSGSTFTLATPVCMAAMATALATLAGISAVNALGNILIGLNSDSFILLAIAYAAAILLWGSYTFISKFISFALVSIAPLNIPGKAKELLT